MEFVGNQINIKTILATLTVAFFIGRVNLFGGTFPAAVALITVMVAVSTVYIYLIPVMAAAMMTYSGQGVDFYGDLMAMIFCGVFFLFFHQHRFNINQRTAITAAAIILFNCLYYAAGHILYLLSIETLIKEAVAVIIYIRVFNTLARVLFVGRLPGKQSGEKVGLALEIAVVSLIGAAGSAGFVLPAWLFAVLTVQYCRGIQPALAMTAVAAVFSQCGRSGQPEFFAGVMAALLIGWYIAALIDGKYRKTVLAASAFAVLALIGEGHIYGIAAAMAVFIALPQRMLSRVWWAAEERLAPEAVSDADLKLSLIKRNLYRKKQAFSSLAKLYGRGVDSRQIISYQFSGMARTVDGLIQDLSGRGVCSGDRELPAIPVGQASYAFEEVSGDSCMSFSFGRNKQALIISDGMGKGSRAAVESKLVVTTMAELMEAGFDVDIAMKTVNAILMTGRENDMFATVDLAVIDKETGRAQIFKMGAASTFVKHDGKVSALKRAAPPAGIVDGVKLEYIDIRLKRGDMLLMVSDGITDCDRNDPDCIWLRERFAMIGSRDPDTVAELIINKAAEKYGIRERDDLTVMAAAI